MELTLRARQANSLTGPSKRRIITGGSRDMPTITGLRSITDLAVTLLIVVTCVVLLWKALAPPSGPEAPIPANPIPIEGAPGRGSATASVVIVGFSDYECIFCYRFEQSVLPAIEDRYIRTGVVQLVYRHYPIESIHPNALRAAAASVCADRQGHFLEMHERLFRHQKDLSRETIVAQATGVGLDLVAFEGCIDSDEIVGQVKSEGAASAALIPTGTPAFLIGRRTPDGRVEVKSTIAGVRSVEEFSKEIDSVLTGGSQWRSIVALCVLAATMITISIRLRTWRRAPGSGT